MNTYQVEVQLKADEAVLNGESSENLISDDTSGTKSQTRGA